MDEVPLPARCGFWAMSGGVAVEAVTRDGDGPTTRRAIVDRLEAWQVPVRELHLREQSSELQRPLPLRCDLRETSFDGGLTERQPEQTRLPAETLA